MKDEYIITENELANKGLNLSDYVFDETFVPAIINMGLDIAISRCSYLNDNFLGESSVESALDEKPELVNAFKKLQYRIIYNLVFTAETEPVDQYVDTIIVHELGWGKINGIQKGLWYKNY